MGSLRESASFCQDVTTRQLVASVYWYSNPHYSANPAGVYSHFFSLDIWIHAPQNRCFHSFNIYKDRNARICFPVRMWVCALTGTRMLMCRRVGQSGFSAEWNPRAYLQVTGEEPGDAGDAHQALGHVRAPIKACDFQGNQSAAQLGVCPQCV